MELLLPPVIFTNNLVNLQKTMKHPVPTGTGTNTRHSGIPGNNTVNVSKTLNMELEVLTATRQPNEGLFVINRIRAILPVSVKERMEHS